MTDRELMQQALEAVEFYACGDEIDEALIIALRERLAQPEQEPVAWMNPSWADPDTRGWPSDSFQSIPTDGWMHLYTAPPQREWVGLTHSDIVQCLQDTTGYLDRSSVRDQLIFARAIEAKLKEKNT